jgi:rRNA small subunit pseudouridine methyltransferase Nep1
MVQLLHKLSVRSANANQKLLSVIRNPITDHLPTKCRKIGFSFDAQTVKLRKYVKELPKDESVVFFVGAMAHGEDKFENAEEFISISDYPLSASVACGKLCNSFEDLWGII